MNYFQIAVFIFAFLLISGVSYLGYYLGTTESRDIDLDLIGHISLLFILGSFIYSIFWSIFIPATIILSIGYGVGKFFKRKA